MKLLEFEDDKYSQVQEYMELNLHVPNTHLWYGAPARLQRLEDTVSEMGTAWASQFETWALFHH